MWDFKLFARAPRDGFKIGIVSKSLVIGAKKLLHKIGERNIADDFTLAIYNEGKIIIGANKGRKQHLELIILASVAEVMTNMIRNKIFGSFEGV